MSAVQGLEVVASISMDGREALSALGSVSASRSVRFRRFYRIATSLFQGRIQDFFREGAKDCAWAYITLGVAK